MHFCYVYVKFLYNSLHFKYLLSKDQENCTKMFHFVNNKHCKKNLDIFQRIYNLCGIPKHSSKEQFCSFSLKKSEKKVQRKWRRIAFRFKKNGTRVFIVITILIAYHTHFVVSLCVFFSNAMFRDQFGMKKPPWVIFTLLFNLLSCS